MCSKYDLYSKSKVRIDVEKVKPYYISLIEKVNALIGYFNLNQFLNNICISINLSLADGFSFSFNSLQCSIFQQGSDGDCFSCNERVMDSRWRIRCIKMSKIFKHRPEIHHCCY